MSTNPSLTFPSTDGFVAELAEQVAAFGFHADVTDTGGGVVAARVHVGGGVILVTPHEGELVLSMHTVDGVPVGPEDGEALSLAECVARALVQRINCDEL